MIKVTIRQAAIKRGIKTPRQLAKVVEVKDAVAWRWWNWTASTGQDSIPTVKSLDKICDKLDCELSDLIVRNGKRKKK